MSHNRRILQKLYLIVKWPLFRFGNTRGYYLWLSWVSMSLHGTSSMSYNRHNMKNRQFIDKRPLFEFKWHVDNCSDIMTSGHLSINWQFFELYHLWLIYDVLGNVIDTQNNHKNNLRVIQIRERGHSTIKCRFFKIYRLWLIDDVTCDIINTHDNHRNNLWLISNRMRGHLLMFRQISYFVFLEGAKGRGFKFRKGKNMSQIFMARGQRSLRIIFVVLA